MRATLNLVFRKKPTFFVCHFWWEIFFILCCFPKISLPVLIKISFWNTKILCSFTILSKELQLLERTWSWAQLQTATTEPAKHDGLNKFLLHELPSRSSLAISFLAVQSHPTVSKMVYSSMKTYLLLKMGYTTQPVLWCHCFLEKCLLSEERHLVFMKFQPVQEPTNQMFSKWQVKWTTPTEFRIITSGFFFFHSPPTQTDVLWALPAGHLWHRCVLHHWCLSNLAWQNWSNALHLRTKSLGPSPKSTFLMEISKE